MVKCEAADPEENVDWVLRQPTLELGQSDGDLPEEPTHAELEEELRGAPEEMLRQYELEQEDLEIPPTQPDSPQLTPLKDAAARKEPHPTAQAVNAELEKTKAALAVKAMDSEDVRKLQLTMRAAEKEKKEALNAEKAAAKKAAAKPKAKAKGRPRKVDVTPPKRLRRKTSVSELKVASPEPETEKPVAKKGRAASEKKGAKDCKKGVKATKDAAEAGGSGNNGAKKDLKKAASAASKKRPAAETAGGKADGAAAGSSKALKHGRHAGKHPAEEPDVELQAEMTSVIEKFANKEYDRKGETMHQGKYGDDLQVVVYWSRGTVGVKLRLADGWAQRYYYSFKESSIALNIFIASKICEKIQENGVEWQSSPEALHFDKVIRATAAAAIASSKKED